MDENDLRSAEKLILDLYSGTLAPEQIKETEKQLQFLQKSPQGWLLGHSLLQHDDNSYLQFFGALTLQIKINNDWDTLSPSDHMDLCKSILQKLLSSPNMQRFVLSKLLCTLSSLVIKYSVSGSTNILNFSIHTLALGVFPEVEDAKCFSSSSRPSFTPRNAFLAISFLHEFFIEAGTSPFTTQDENKLYKMVFEMNAEDAVELLRATFSQATQSSFEYGISIEAAISCTASFASYLCKNGSTISLVLPGLQDCLNMLIELLAVPQLSDKVMVVLTDLLSNYQQAFSKELTLKLWDILTGSWGMGQLQSLLQSAYDGETPEVYFLNLVISFSEAVMGYLLEHLSEQRSVKLLDIMMTLMKFPGYAMVEEEVSWRTIEFWTALIEDFSMSDAIDEPATKEQFIGIVFSAIDNAWKKMLLPQDDVLESWSSQTRDSFITYRRELGDLIESSYSVLGERLYATYIMNVENMLRSADLSWQTLEATLYCLACIFEYECRENEVLNSWLVRLYKTRFPQKVAEFKSPRLLKTTTALLSNTSAFLKDQPEFLSFSLPVLFDALSIDRDAIQIPVSRAIQNLCNTCAALLVPEAPNFLNVVKNITPSLINTPSALERIYSSIGFVIRRMETANDRIFYLHQLLECLHAQVDRELTYRTRKEDIQSVLISVLQCIHGLAKSQSPPKGFAMVDVDDAQDDVSKYWTDPNIQAFREYWLSFLKSVEQIVPDYSIAADFICNIIIVGLSEIEPTPFSLPTDTVAKLFAERFPKHPLAKFLSLLVSLFTSPYGQRFISNDVFQIIIGTLQHTDIWNKHGFLQTQVDVLSELFRFYSVAFQKHPETMLSNYADFSREVIERAISSLISQDRLVEVNASQLVNTFIKMHRMLGPNKVVPAHTTFLDRYRKPIISQIIRGFCGAAPRSSIPTLTNVLGNLKLQNFAATKDVLSDILLHSIPEEIIPFSTRQQFLKDLLKVHFKEKVKDFWLKCKGINDSIYATSSWTF
ncbi:karyopherin Kap111 [Schizosaccharomyces japonicus yFS275]|uniref:Karyopherin Kap111 n=1 Tax=Schizosaccharomyces japonicus (strain yFS275 / FY16936) TaxID=402676 RepID=B6JX41_SCHJY|nr:karyopherin Kap111 [Schizosaccharomyces japonicus yFS275]EEB05942.2 karyopherin Kap111 [Schizosaccharomyces japonicus yFS275]